MTRTLAAFMLLVGLILGAGVYQAQPASAERRERSCYEFFVGRRYVVIVNTCTEGPPLITKIKIRDLPEGLVTELPPVS